MIFIGQAKLRATLESYTINTLPQTLLFLGEDGCGKKSLIKELANRLGLSLIKLTEKIEPEVLVEYQQRPIKSLYLIDLGNFTEKEQNSLLKFIEEPSNTVYVALISESENGILPTILTRCMKLRFEPYTVEQLKQVKNFQDELIYKICKTPGQLINIDEKQLSDLYELCLSIVTKIKVAPYANMLSVAPRINYKESYNKFDFKAFFNMLEHVAFDSYYTTKDPVSFKIYLYCIIKRQNLINATLAKEAFMINFLDGLWKETR